jgi:probable biosynthetic protein (TIGR04098 family)
MRWLDSDFTVGMPHMVPGQLSEVELLKLLGDAQWQAITSILGLPSQEIVNDQGERLYASFIHVGVSLGDKTCRDFGEGSRVHIRHTAQVYARRFVEGVLFFDDSEIPDSRLPTSINAKSLAESSVPHVYMTNAFVTREVSNLRLRTFVPAGGAPEDDAVVDQMPFGIRDHEEIQRTGELALEGLSSALPVPGLTTAPVIYPIMPESDVNGAGLLYFARYVAILNYGERRILREGGATPVSAPLIAQLSTERRRIFYVANADVNDSIRIQSRVFVTSCSGEPASDPTLHVPLQFHFLTDLYRVSDGALMAKSVVRKALCIPNRAKNLVYEASRLARAWGLD